MGRKRGILRSLALFAAMLALLLGDGGVIEATGSSQGDNYTAQLLGTSEVPSRTTPASGEAAFQVSPDGQSLTYTITVRDIANVTMGHIHLGAIGTNGDIVLPLVPPTPVGSGPSSGIIGQGTLTAAQLTGPLQGQPFGALIAQMDAGNAYVNIHTATGASPARLMAGDLPPGEIRGQVMQSPVPIGMPIAGGGFGAQKTLQPWCAVLAVLLTLGLASLLHAQRRDVPEISR